MFQDLLLSADFLRPENKAHVQSILLRKASEASALADACDSIASGFSCMPLNHGNAVYGEIMGGFNQVEFIQHLSKTVLADDGGAAALHALCAFFQELGRCIFTSGTMQVSFVAEESARALVEDALTKVIRQLPATVVSLPETHEGAMFDGQLFHFPKLIVPPPLSCDVSSELRAAGFLAPEEQVMVMDSSMNTGIVLAV